MCPGRTFRSDPRTVGVRPAQAASLRALPNRVMSPISATMTSAVNSPTPGSVRSTLTRRSALACWCSSPSIRPVTGARPPVTARQSVTISREAAGRTRLGQPAAARSGPVARAAVITVVGGDRVDPVPQAGTQPDQADPVPDQGAELADLRRGDPRLREQVGPQQLRQDRGAGPCRSSAAPRRSPCTAAGAPGAPRSRNPPAGRPASPTRRQPGRHRRPGGQVPDQLEHRLGAVHNILVDLHLPVLGDHCHPATACGAHRCRRRPDIAGSPLPSLESLTRSVLLPG